MTDEPAEPTPEPISGPVADVPPDVDPVIDPADPDPEIGEVLAATSVAPDEDALTRRRFVQALVVGGGVLAVGGGLYGALHKSHHSSSSTSPTTVPSGVATVGSDEGILLVIMMGGGNDGLNTLVPFTDPTYQALRRDIAVPRGQVLPLGTDTGMGLHPELKRLKTRYDAGQVAIVRGVGKLDDDHSHFSSMPTWMAGNSDKSRDTGWLGRYADTLAGSDKGFKTMAIGNSVPLHLVGHRSEVTSIPVGDDPFGANRSKSYDAKLFDAVAAYGASTSGLGSLADAWSAVGTAAMDRATVVAPLYEPKVAIPDGDLTSQLDLAARLINLDLGARVVAAGYATFDQHHNQPHDHAALLADFDAAIERFYATLAPKWAKRVTILTFSEFGRRAAQNDSLGTDHGTAGVMFVMGDQVRGGLYGRQPLLTKLDANGDLQVLVDFRSVYASVLQGWLNAAPDKLLGAHYPTIGFFKGKPGT